MLGPMRVADQFRELESRLPSDWADARLVLEVEDAAHSERAAALLAPLAPGRVGRRIQVTVPRAGGRVDLLRRLLERIDAVPVKVPEAQAARVSWPVLEESWLAAVAALPEDWSDLYAEIEVASSDFLDPGALRLAPLNPSRPDRGLAFRFRVARSFGYGASSEMARRCLARLDEDGIKGRLAILWALSDTKAVATQGPVWYGESGPV